MAAQTVSDRNSAGTSVEFNEVRRVFGETVALDGLTLELEPGEMLALLGPSGCGKTTALRLLAGFDNPDGGTILVDGKDITGVPANKRDMGMVFQSYSLFPTMSALDNVAFGLRLRGQSTTVRRKRASEILELVGLSEHINKYAHQLSGGQQQRVALARALAISPRVLLLDEPLSALDAKVREQLRDEIRRLQIELGVTTLIVTHDQEEALSMADRVGVMRAGQLEQCAPPAELYARPATPFVAQFVGTMNKLSGTVRPGGQVQIGDQALSADGALPASGSGVSILVRPEALQISADDGPGSAVVTISTFRGAVTRLRLQYDDGHEVLADVPSHRASELAPGTRVRVQLLDRPVLVADAGNSDQQT